MVSPQLGSGSPDHLAADHLAADYLATVQSSAVALADLAEDDPTLIVPGCPAWTLADLVHHVGAVYLHVSELTRSRPVSGKEVKTRLGPVRAPAPGTMRAWFTQATDTLVDTLAAAGEDERIWSWSSERTVAFWIRRMCHETVVHEWDAASAHGEDLRIEPGLAGDGIDEFVTHFVPLMRRRRSAVAASGEHYLVECTDVASASWDVAFGEGALDAGADGSGTAPPDPNPVALRGAAQDLLLRFWRRPLQPNPDPDPDSLTAAGFERWWRVVGCP
ncbi:maleylpyruvate isomerase family mycothiol-dependent enzyme [Actinospica robiniae]|uniref:maleylpyruvate isomerase family mycothiol-dependent enzyme n=1 Tax=Actinospica robiniae TaxID=304901 RepID=UPI00040F85A8|nr:maleylpyruvate isomerase family mycothiol-dependent enzyme [Actinospica robiniae]